MSGWIKATMQQNTIYTWFSGYALLQGKHFDEVNCKPRFAKYLVTNES